VTPVHLTSAYTCQVHRGHMCTARCMRSLQLASASDFLQWVNDMTTASLPPIPPGVHTRIRLSVLHVHMTLGSEL
jgi:hypothetical protein